MITDQLVSFLPPGTNLPVTNAAVYSNVVDLLGPGVGVTPEQAGIIIGQTVSKFGADQGVGIIVPELICAVGTAFAGTGTLTVTFEGAQDNGSGSPGTYQIFDASPAMTITQLAAASFFYRRKWPIEYPDGFNPRFTRLGFTPSGTFTAGTVAFAVVTMGPAANFSKFQGKNFVVAG
jgi:hypothetical protein